MSAKIIRISHLSRKQRDRQTLRAVLDELATIRKTLDRIEKVSAPLAWWEQRDEQA